MCAQYDTSGAGTEVHTVNRCYANMVCLSIDFFLSFVVMALNACSEKFLACIIYLRGVHMLSDSKTCQDICLIKFALVNVDSMRLPPALHDALCVIQYK